MKNVCSLRSGQHELIPLCTLNFSIYNLSYVHLAKAQSYKTPQKTFMLPLHKLSDFTFKKNQTIIKIKRQINVTLN